ncbi:30S ribosomal protein S20 [candidate division KSB1 bacterium]|nr:30S ribosomal protein S20 [candidate division KSB1 bacterium]
MATHQSAIKRMRQAKKRTAKNRQERSALKTMTKKVLAAPTQADAKVLLKDVTSVLDKMAGKGVIHRNKAANQKSRLARFANKLPATVAA